MFDYGAKPVVGGLKTDIEALTSAFEGKTDIDLTGRYVRK